MTRNSVAAIATTIMMLASDGRVLTQLQSSPPVSSKARLDIANFCKRNLIMRDGSPAPGTSVNFNEPTEFYMADTGKLVFAAGIANNTGRGIWTGDESGLELLARVGDDAPDTAWNFTSLNNIAISRNGRIAFSGVLDAPGFQYGVWTTDENGDVHKLIQTGDTVNVEGVGPRTISSLLYGGQRTNDNFVIDDTGRVFLRAQFTNGLGGVFSVAIPEPGGLAAAGAALATLARRRRRTAPSLLRKGSGERQATFDCIRP